MAAIAAPAPGERTTRRGPRAQPVSRAERVLELAADGQRGPEPTAPRRTARSRSDGSCGSRDQRDSFETCPERAAKLFRDRMLIRSRAGRAGPRRAASARARGPGGRGRPCRPARARARLRAAVPMSRTIRPPLPIRIAFCDSVSAQTWARISNSPSSRSSALSTITSTACGTSSRVRRRTCSRISSARWISLGESERSSGG